MALFIVFEGGDGSGKSTQAKALYERLRQRKSKYRDSVIYTQEPGGTAFGQLLRGILASTEGKPLVALNKPSQLVLVEPPIGDEALPSITLGPATPRMEFLYFLLSRAQLVEDVIQPNLKKGKIVICDRYAPSSIAYQGYGRGLDLRIIEEANSIATKGLKPDLVVLLDLEADVGIARKWGTSKLERLDKEGIAFHKMVREGYLKMAAAEPDRWLVIDASQPKGKIAKIIWEKVNQLLAKDCNDKRSL
jgi:dTMP kinase